MSPGTTAAGRTRRGPPIRRTGLAGALLLAASGCAAAPGPAVLETREGRIERVEALRGDPDRLDEDRFGAFVGGLAGALVGSAFGEGAGRAAATGLGLVAGILIGTVAETLVESEGAVRVEVLLEDGTVLLLRMPFRAGLGAGKPVRVHYLEGGRVRLEAA